MADPHRYSGTGARPGRQSPTGTPRWVKVFGTIILVVILLFVILLFTKGPHRPGLHASSGGPGGYTLFSATEIRVPSEGGHV